MQNFLIHRYGVFCEDGTAHTYGHLIVLQGLHLPPPPKLDIPHAGTVYIRPMDDDADHWTRLHAEWVIWCDPATRDLAHGDASLLTHVGAKPHPTLPHVRLGGTFAWAADPHPRVARHIAFLQSLDERGLVRHFCGPTALGDPVLTPDEAARPLYEGR